MKKAIGLLVIMILCLSLAAPSAFAGSKQRYRWQGVAMGVGAAILGHAIYQSRQDDTVYRQVAVVDCPPGPWCGHWEVTKVWVAPVREKVWNPGHYNRYHRWVAGRWMTVEKSPGFWKKERVWVASR